jgi:hypothetical protein
MSILQQSAPSVAPASVLPVACACPDEVSSPDDLCPECLADFKRWRGAHASDDLALSRYVLGTDTPCHDEAPEQPVHCWYEGPTSIEIVYKGSRWWVDYRVGGSLEDAWSFPSREAAREFSLALFGDSGCEPDALSPSEAADAVFTVTPFAHWCDELDPVNPDLETEFAGYLWF